MKANELMFGDFIKLPDGANAKVISIAQDGVYFEDSQSEGVASFDNLSPIPLTPEILEKNGFVKSERYEVWKIIQDDYEMRITPWRFAVIFLEDGADKEEFSIPRPNFIHELQHALRLCGIEKEITI